MGNIRNIRRLLVLFGGGVVIFVSVMIGQRLGGKKSVEQQARPLSSAAEMALRQIRFSEMRAGQKQWDVAADRAEYDKQTDLTLLQGVRFVVYGHPETGQMSVTADRAEYRQQARDIRLVGRVQAIGEKGVRFEADEVTYLGALAMFKSPSRVKLVDGRLTVEGIGMEFFTKEQRGRINRQVSAEIAPARTDR
ncbi:MAG TPA: LPS export ABC transporter periplasmic protein LptC [Geobacteraceae bacterium]